MRPHLLRDELQLKRMRTATGWLLAADLVLLGLVAWQGEGLGVWLAPARYFSAGVTLLLAAFVWLLTRRLSTSALQTAKDASLLTDAFDAVPAAVAMYDAQDRMLLCNADFRQIYRAIADICQPGVRFEDLLRTAVTRGLVPEAAGRAEAWIAERMAMHRRPGGPMVRQQADGRWRRIIEYHLPDGRLLAYSMDITELQTQRAQTEAALLAAERAGQRLADAIEALPDAFVLFDADDRIVAFNQRYREMYRESADAIEFGAQFEALLRLGMARGQYAQAVGREEEWLAERMAQHCNPSGSIVQELPDNRWVRIDERRTRDGGLAGVRTDISDLVHREQSLARLNRQLDTMNSELSHLSETDALTGLANRRQFDRRLTEEMARAQRHGIPLALLLFDVDHFKAYNDRHGHPAGDACLQQVATVLRGSALRSGDLVARWGGEEFAMLLPHTPAAEARQQAQRCLDAMDAARVAHGASPLGGHVTLSAGLAVFEDGDAGRALDLVKAADAALYRAKQSGRHRVAS